MKRVYLVRHGATAGNAAKMFQHLDTPLSDAGRAQAALLAERFSKIEFEVLIASTMERAQETAHTIGARTGHEVVSEHLFHELLRPTAIRGKHHADPDADKIFEETQKLWDVPDTKHSDEENFFDLKARAEKALQFLIDRPEKTIAVVTYGTFLNMLITVMLGGAATDPALFKKFDGFIYSNNTGITWCDYDTKERPGAWRMMTWNDHAHLG